MRNVVLSPYPASAATTGTGIAARRRSGPGHPSRPGRSSHRASPAPAATSPCDGHRPGSRPGPGGWPPGPPAPGPPAPYRPSSAGQNSRQPAAHEACSFTRCTLTPTWQLPVLPSVPEYCRATHGEAFPSFGNPVSSMTSASTGSLAREPPRHVRPDRRVIPRRGRDELLQPLMIGTQPRRHRLHRLALPVRQQPARIQLARRALVLARQAAEHLRGKARQPGPDLRDLLRSHASDHTTKPGSRPDLTKSY